MQKGLNYNLLTTVNLTIQGLFLFSFARVNSHPVVIVSGLSVHINDRASNCIYFFQYKMRKESECFNRVMFIRQKFKKKIFI